MACRFLIVVVLLGASTLSAQSLGGIARQERARRAALSKRAAVIINEDLQRPRIFRDRAGHPAPPATSPAPAAAAEVSSQGTAEPARVPDAPLWKVAEQPGFSLGEYARQLRQQRTLAAATAPAGTGRGPVPSDSAANAIQTGQGPAGTEPPSTGADPIRVRRGDSMWKLSSVYLGQGQRWVALWKANPEVRNPDVIHPGQLLRWPSDAMLVAATPAAPRVRPRSIDQHTALPGASLRSSLEPLLGLSGAFGLELAPLGPVSKGFHHRDSMPVYPGALRVHPWFIRGW